MSTTALCPGPKVAVVGGGAAGFYATQQIAKVPMYIIFRKAYFAKCLKDIIHIKNIE